VDGKNPVGRPRKYTPELLEEIKHYIENYKEVGDEIPSIAGLSCEIDVSRVTLHKWAHDPDKEEYSYTYNRLMASQERTTLNGGLNSKFNAAVTALVLSNHGYSKTVEQKIDATMKYSAMSDDELDRKIQQLEQSADS